MKDPGPNVLEQQIETNRLLTLILAASGAPAPEAGSSPGVSGGGSCQWPALFSWSNGPAIPFVVAGSTGSYASISSADNTQLSGDSSIKVVVLKGTGLNATLDIGLPMGPKEAPRLQFACMSKNYPYACGFVAEFTYGNQSNFLKAGVRLQETGANLEYLNSSGVWTATEQYLYDYYEMDWRKVQLAVNFAEGKYCGVGVNADWFDLSAQGVQVGAATATKRLTLTITVGNNSADTPVEAYLDQILVTDELYTGPPE